MKKINKKFLIVILILMVLTLIICTVSEGINVDYYEPSSNASYQPNFLNTIGSIIGPLQVIGSGLSIIIFIAIGIKYMVSSVEEKAGFKETMMPYIIGAIFIFASSNIATIIYNLVN